MGKSAATRARLQREALRLFADRGYDETTIADIAAAAGVTQMTFFRHFPAKELVVVDDPYDPAIAQAVAVQAADLPVVERVRHLRNPGCSGDIRNRRLVVAAIGEQPQRFSLEPRPGSR